MEYQDYIHWMTQSEYVEERVWVADQLRGNFTGVPDKEQALEDLLLLTKDDDKEVRRSAASALGFAFPHVTDKQQATKAFLVLTKDEDEDVRNRAGDALGSAFLHVTDKEQAWKALLSLAKEENNYVRSRAGDALGSAFLYVTDKEQAWKALLSLTKNEYYDVRCDATDMLGSAFPHVTDKQQAWKALLSLTKDEHNAVRSQAYHSLGKISILRATDGEESHFKKELEKALKYFKKSAYEATSYMNPAKFCFPFYRSFYNITFKKEDAESEVKKSIEEAKKAVEGSESKARLLEAIENLSNALTEVQKQKNLSISEIQGDLNAYSRYCDRAADLLGETEEKAPGATIMVRKGLPIIDQQIKDIIEEIKEKARELCRDTLDTPFEKEGIEVNSAGQDLFNVRDPIGLEKSVDNLQMALSAVCDRMPEEHKGEACKILAEAKNEQFVEDKLDLINMILSKIPSLIINSNMTININQYGNDNKALINSTNNSNNSTNITRNSMADFETLKVLIEKDYKKEDKSDLIDVVEEIKEFYNNPSKKVLLKEKLGWLISKTSEVSSISSLAIALSKILG